MENLKYKTNEYILQNRYDSDIEGRRGGGGMDWESGISRCNFIELVKMFILRKILGEKLEWTLSPIQYFTQNGQITRSYCIMQGTIQYTVINHDTKEYKKECI